MELADALTLIMKVISIVMMARNALGYLTA